MSKPRIQGLTWEIILILLSTFGMSGLRSIVNVILSTINPAPMNSQSVTLNAGTLISQLFSIVTLMVWGLLAIYLLHSIRPPEPMRSLGIRAQVGWSCALAAIIGLPGLALYITALHLGLSKEVIIATSPLFIFSAIANAFAEEIVVVRWCGERLRQQGLGIWLIIILCALLRGSYHLYQGYSAGLGNFIMGVIFGYFYWKKRNIWPLVGAHAIIDTLAFAGYPLMANIMSIHG